MSATSSSSSHLQKINEFFPWTTESSVVHQNILCLDASSLIASNHSGEFLFTSLLLKLLQQIHVHKQPESLPRVVLCLTNHVRSHYEVILRKNYLDLRHLERQGHLVILNIVSTEEEREEYVMAHEDKDSVLTWAQLQDLQQTHNLQFNALMTQLQSKESLPNNEESQERKSIWMFDDLEMLEVVANSIQDCKLFFSRLSKQLEMNAYYVQEGKQLDKITELSGIISFGRHPEQVKTQLPSMKDSAVLSFDTSEHFSAQQALHEDGQARLTEYLRYRASLALVASPLQTGYSSHIHGTISIHSQNKAKLLLQYKALDSGILCAPLGDGW